MTETIDALGNVTTATYEPWFRFLQLTGTDRHGNTTTYERDAATGNITKRINADGTFATYAYNSKNYLTRETDESGHSTYYIYDASGTRMIKKAVPLNGTEVYSETANPENFAITEYSYYADGELSNCPLKGLLKAEKDPEGRTIVYGYDQYGNTTRVRELDATPSNLNATNLLTLPGKEVTKTYNRAGQITQMTDAMGIVTTYTYDAKGNLATETLNGTDVTSYTYDHAGRVIKKVEPVNYTGSASDPGTVYTYYSHGKIHTQTDAEGNTTTYTYDLYGNMLTETKPNGVILSYEYDPIKRLKGKYISENGGPRRALETYAYDLPLGSAAQADDGETWYMDQTISYDGRTSSYVTKTVKDARRRTVRVIAPDGAVTETVYNANGTVAQNKNPLGYRTLHTYNGLKLETETRVEVTEGIFNYTIKEYDKAGRQTSEKIGKSSVSATEALDEEDVIETVKTYHLDGTVSASEVIGGAKTTFEYDLNGNITKEEEWIDDTHKATTVYTNNYLGKPTTVTRIVDSSDLVDGDESEQTNLVVTYTYDQSGNVLTTISPDGVETINTYDTLGRATRTKTECIDEYGRETYAEKWNQYDSVGNLAVTCDENGNITKYSFDSLGNAIRQEKRNGAETLVSLAEYNLRNQLLYQVTPGNYLSGYDITQMNRIEYAYDEVGRQILKKAVYKKSAGDAQFTEQILEGFEYDAAGNKIKEITGEAYARASGSTIEEKIENADGTEYVYDGKGRIYSMRDPESKDRELAFTMKYTYDGADRKIEEQTAGDAATRTVYQYVYNSMGNITYKYLKTESGSMLLESAAYNRKGMAVSKTDGNGNTSSYTYNSLGMVKTETMPGDETIDENTVTYLYDRLGRQVYREDSYGQIQKKTLNHQGQTIEETSQNESQTQKITITKAYDKKQNLRFETDGNGNTTEYVYDGQDQNTAKIQKTGINQNRIERKVYDRDGNVIQSIDWRNNVTQNQYDALGRVTAVIDPYGHTVEKMEYNLNNQQIKQYTLLEAPRNYAVTTYEYDKNDRLIKTIYPEGNSEEQSYNDQGQLAAKTDGKGNITSYSYDQNLNLSSVTNALNESTYYSYDLNRNMISQTDGRQNTSLMEYNARNLLIRQIDPGGKNGNAYDPTKTERYTYYVNGLQKTKTTKESDTITYTYDIHGRQIGESVGDMNHVRTYDANGNELSMQDDGTTTRTYDALNRTLTKTTPGFGQTVYEYDIIIRVNEGGYAEKTTDPQGNVTIKEYDRVGRLIRVQDRENAAPTEYEYDEAGRQKTVTYDNGAREEYAYDQNGRLIQLKNYQGKNIKESYSYTYDANGNQLSENKVVNGTSEQLTYAYDAVNRLVYADEGANRHREYTYDAAGNRSSETIVDAQLNTTQVMTYSYNSQNRLTSISSVGGTETFTYDNNGNMTKSSQGDFWYDELNRLTLSTAKNAEGELETTHYYYNADGQRTSKMLMAELEETKYLYDGEQVILEQYRNNIQNIERETRNVYGMNIISRSSGEIEEELYTISESSKVRVSYSDKIYYQYNGHGDVTQVTNSGGNILASYKYDAFGQIIEKSGTADNPYRYAGYQYDEEQQKYYLNARYYDARIARFISEDTYWNTSNMIYGDNPDENPVPNTEAMMQALNLYAYGNNNPIRYIDPTGQRIIVNGTQEERDSIMENLSELTDTPLELVPEMNEDGTVAYYYVSEIEPKKGNKPTGTRLVHELVNSDDTVTIQYFKEGEEGLLEGNAATEAISTENATRLGVGSSSQIFLSRKQGQTLVQDRKTGNTYMADEPAYILLGHELIHAWRNTKGISLSRKGDAAIGTYWYRDTKGKIKKATGYTDELATIGLSYIAYGVHFNKWKGYNMTENALRDEHGLDRRVNID